MAEVALGARDPLSKQTATNTSTSTSTRSTRSSDSTTNNNNNANANTAVAVTTTTNTNTNTSNDNTANAVAVTTTNTNTANANTDTDTNVSPNTDHAALSALQASWREATDCVDELATLIRTKELILVRKRASLQRLCAANPRATDQNDDQHDDQHDDQRDDQNDDQHFRVSLDAAESGSERFRGREKHTRFNLVNSEGKIDYSARVHRGSKGSDAGGEEDDSEDSRSGRAQTGSGKSVRPVRRRCLRASERMRRRRISEKHAESSEDSTSLKVVRSHRKHLSVELSNKGNKVAAAVVAAGPSAQEKLVHLEWRLQQLRRQVARPELEAAEGRTRTTDKPPPPPPRPPRQYPNSASEAISPRNATQQYPQSATETISPTGAKRNLGSFRWAKLKRRLSIVKPAVEPPLSLQYFQEPDHSVIEGVMLVRGSWRGAKTGYFSVVVAPASRPEKASKVWMCRWDDWETEKVLRWAKFILRVTAVGDKRLRFEMASAHLAATSDGKHTSKNKSKSLSPSPSTAPPMAEQWVHVLSSRTLEAKDTEERDTWLHVVQEVVQGKPREQTRSGLGSLPSTSHSLSDISSIHLTPPSSHRDGKMRYLGRIATAAALGNTDPVPNKAHPSNKNYTKGAAKRKRKHMKKRDSGILLESHFGLASSTVDDDGSLLSHTHTSLDTSAHSLHPTSSRPSASATTNQKEEDNNNDNANVPADVKDKGNDNNDDNNHNNDDDDESESESNNTSRTNNDNDSSANITTNTNTNTDTTSTHGTWKGGRSSSSEREKISLSRTRSPHPLQELGMHKSPGSLSHDGHAPTTPKSSIRPRWVSPALRRAQHSDANLSPLKSMSASIHSPSTSHSHSHSPRSQSHSQTHSQGLQPKRLNMCLSNSQATRRSASHHGHHPMEKEAQWKLPSSAASLTHSQSSDNLKNFGERGRLFLPPPPAMASLDDGSDSVAHRMTHSPPPRHRGLHASDNEVSAHKGSVNTRSSLSSSVSSVASNASSVSRHPGGTASVAASGAHPLMQVGTGAAMITRTVRERGRKPQRHAEPRRASSARPPVDRARLSGTQSGRTRSGGRSNTLGRSSTTKTTRGPGTSEAEDAEHEEWSNKEKAIRKQLEKWASFQR